MIVLILAGVFAFGFCLWFLGPHGYMRGAGDPFLVTIATGAAAVATPGLWSAFAQNRPPFSWGWTMVAGLVSVVVSNILTWMVYLTGAEAVALIGQAKSPPVETMSGVLGRLLLIAILPFMSLLSGAMSTVVTGIYTGPLAVIACLAGTAWCRWRLGRAGHPAFATPDPPQKS